MRRIRRVRPSSGQAALVVSCVALVAAVAGDAIAEVATTALTKKKKRQTRNIANKQINQRAPGLSVANAATANSANTATSADTATTATAANSLNGKSILENFTLNFDFAIIAAETCVQGPFSRDGVLATDEVIVTPPESQNLGILTQAITRADANEVKLVACNVTAAPINPPAGDYEFSIIR